jgi:hypothetical protein
MRYQKLYNIVFSDKRSFRWERHLLFWLAVFFYHLVRIGLMMPGIDNWAAFGTLIEFSFFRGVVPNILFSYSIVYYSIPRFFNRGKYFLFVIGVLLSIGLMQFYGMVNDVFHHGSPIHDAIAGNSSQVFKWADWQPGFIRLFGNPPLICGLFLAIKLLKNWHQEQLKTETLAKENANAELQLLKAQVHPHFLFNTLNNIYSFSLNRSPQAGILVKKLSGMLGYMINECEEKLVPLEKELGLIQDYMGLENVRYGKRLNMQVDIQGDFANKLIAPLLMIPFVENSFKHGTSQMLQHPWIKLDINTFGNQLFLKLSNSKPPLTHIIKQHKGIGLSNVKKRLQLLYFDQHQLDIVETADTFTVSLQILLEGYIHSGNKMIEAKRVVAYA